MVSPDRSSVRQRSLRWLAHLGLLLALLHGCSDVASNDAQGPAARNLLLITVDTWRGDHFASSRGGVPLTPRLDRFAAQGILFTQASSPGNATSPGIAGLLTGLLPRRAGVVLNSHRLQEEVPTLATTLGAQGFVTAAFVANPVLAAEHGFAQGFARYELLSRTRRQTEGHADQLTRDAFSWLEFQPSDERTFLWLHYMDPHGPYEPPDRYRALFDNEHFDGARGVPLLRAGDQSGRGGIPGYQQAATGGSRDAREYEARYAAEVRFVDDAIGDLLERLERGGRLEDTVVVVTSDHGEALADDHGHYFSHGHGLTRDQIHVPLLLHCRACGPARVVSHPVSTVDVVPTALRLLGLAVPEDGDGHDLLAGERPSVVVSQSARGLSVRRGDFKLQLVGGAPRALVHLPDDPYEARDLRKSEPELVEALTRAAAEATRPPLVDAVKRNTLGPQELEALRVLGYAE